MPLPKEWEICPCLLQSGLLIVDFFLSDMWAGLGFIFPLGKIMRADVKITGKSRVAKAQACAEIK